MSEKTKADQILERLNKLETDYQSGITKLETALKTLPKVEPPATSKPAHKHSANVEFDCPECEKLFKEQVAMEAVADFKQTVKKMKRPTRCEWEYCGEIYDAEENENCPTCHRHE